MKVIGCIHDSLIDLTSLYDYVVKLFARALEM